MNDTGMLDVVKDVPRTFGREWTKLKYYLPKAIGCLILFLIPVVGQTLAPVLWFLLSAWMMAIQYVDYPFDNHKIGFITMRDALKATSWKVPELRRPGDPLLRHPGGESLRDAGGHLWRHRHVGRPIPQRATWTLNRVIMIKRGAKAPFIT